MGNPDGQLTTWTSRRGRFLVAMDTALDGMAVADLLALLMIVFDGLPFYVAKSISMGSFFSVENGNRI